MVAKGNANAGAVTRVDGTGSTDRPAGATPGGEFAARPGAVDASQVRPEPQQQAPAQQAEPAAPQQQAEPTASPQPIARTESNAPQQQPQQKRSVFTFGTSAVPEVSADSVRNEQKPASDAISAGFKQETPQASAGAEDAPQTASQNVLADLDLKAAGLARRENYVPADASMRMGERDSTPAVKERREEGKPSGDRPVGSIDNILAKNAPAPQGVDEDATADEMRARKDFFPKAYRQEQKKSVPNYLSTLTSQSIDKVGKAIKNLVGGKNLNAQAAYGKVVGDADVPMGYISVGASYINEALAIPGNQMAWYIQQQTGVAVESASQLAELLRNKPVEVGVFKSPDLEPESSCKLLLRVGDGRAISMHPLMFKKFNADTDGDDACVSFWPDAVKRCPDPVKYLINLAGDLTVDPDFFPFYKAIGGIMDDARREAIRDAIDENVTKDGHMAKVIEDMFFVVEKDKQGKALESFFREAYAFCSKRGPIDSAMLNGLITRTYNTLSTINRVAGGYGREHFPTAELLDGFKARTENDRRLYQFTAEVLEQTYVKAKGAANMQDLRAMMRDYLGEPDGTNPSFRFSANVAKMFVNVDTRVQIGSEYEVNEEELLRGVLKYVESRKISEALTLGNRAKDAKEILRERIIREVGMLPDGNNSYEFLDRFIKVYRNESALINAANVTVSVDATHLSRNRKVNINPIDVTAGSVARCLRDVYGPTITVENLLGDAGLGYEPTTRNRQTWTRGGLNVLTKEYGHWDIDRFATQNKFWETGGDGSKDKDARLYKGGQLVQDAPFLVVKALANMRSSTASKFNTDVYNSNGSVCKQMLVVLRRINDPDLLWGDTLERHIELLRLTDPNVYAYFGMDNANGFFSSKYGKALLDATTVQQVGSIRLAMTAEYRMANIHGLVAKRDAMVNGEAKCVPSQIERTQNDIIAEENLLASSSWVWRAVILDARMRDRNEMDRPFLRLKEGRETTLPVKNYKGWDSGKLDKYSTLEEVLLDISLSKDEKCDIVSDVVRVYEGFLGFASYEVPEGLERNPHSAYSILSPTSEGVMSATNEFNKELNKLTKSIIDANEEIDYVFERANRSDMEEALQYYADHPEAYIDMGVDVLADAMCSTLDLVYEQSEKSKQHPWTNALYTALSLVKNGGLFSDVYRTDDRALGLLPMDKVSAYDIVCVLAKRKKLTVYDSRGQFVRLTRDSLVGVENADESDVWEFLRDNPNIAGALRPHSVNASADGHSWLGATGGIEDFLVSRPDPNDIAFRRDYFMLADDPRFAALVALLTPTQGRTSLDLRDEYMENIKAMISLLSNAKSGKSDKEREVAAEALMARFGFEKSRPFAELGIDDVEAMRLYSLIEKSIEDFLGLGLVPCEVESSDRDFDWGYDLSSCYAYYSVRQELSGSKTASSTGVEGDESWRTVVPITSLDIVDEYADLSQYDDGFGREELVEMFGDCWTSLGKPLSKFDESDWKDANDVVIELPDGMRHLDKSIDNDGPQVPSVYSYLLIKRDYGAENFNLKAKKTGDDGLHSVVKHGKFFTAEELGTFDLTSDDYLEIRREIKSIVDAGDIDGAKLWLAKRLKQANKICKYDELTMADCMNIADLMIRVDENGEVFLRSISMICTAIRSQMNYGIVETGTRQEMIDLARKADAECGSKKGDVSELVNNFRHHAYSITLGKVLERPRASSAELNVSMLEKLSQQTGLPVAEKKRHDIETANPAAWRRLKKANYERNKKVGNSNMQRGLKGDYFIAGFEDVAPLCVGPEAVWIIANPTRDQLRQAARQGVTVMSDVPNVWSTRIETDGIDRYITPMFQRRLQGDYAYSADPKFGVFRRPADNIVTLYESRINEYNLTDAGIQLFDKLVDRLKVNWSDTTNMPIENMFANTFAAYPDAQFSAHPVTQEELRRIISGDGSAVIDVGLTPESRDFKKHWKMTMDAIDRYVEAFAKQGQQFKKGGLLDSAAPGEVIGFMALEIHEPGFIGPVPTVYAPIIPFDRTGANGVSRAEVPSHFSIENMYYDDDVAPSQSCIRIDWTFDDSLVGHMLKFFEGQTTANKFFAAISKTLKAPLLRDGTPLDCAVAAASTASRRIGSNRRLGTMQTLMMFARKNGYNFAKVEKAFPNDPMFTNADGEKESIKERLLHGYLTNDEWASVFDGENFSFDFFDRDVDKELDSWIKDEVRRYAANGGNISDYLACEFDGAMTDVYWEFECMFKTSATYQTGLMKFLHAMRPELCGTSVDDAGDGYLFRCSPDDGGEGTHCMQMQVPIDDGRGGIYYSWENVFASWSFFNFNDFTGKSRPNVNGFCDALDAVQTHALSGLEADEKTWRLMMRRAISNMGEFKTPKFGVDVVNMNSSVDIEPEDSKKVNAPKKGERILDHEKWGNVLTLTGHRPNKLYGYVDVDDPAYDKIRERLAAFCKEHNIQTIVSGMALGFDQVGAQFAIDNGLNLVAAIPSEAQANPWKRNPKSVQTWESQIAQADLVVNVGGSETYTGPKEMQDRNEWMLDQADYVFALYNGDKSGGTFNAVSSARKRKLSLHILDPHSYNETDEYEAEGEER